MSKVRVGVVGLGNIAQKAWLPVLGDSADWTLVGAFSPNQQKAQAVCDRWRIPCFSRLEALAAQCDAIFVHSSTATHFSIVDALLRAGIDVCVDKPLAENLHEAEQLVALAEKCGRKLMVAFNRRFAPRYQQLKAALNAPASLRMDKHRTESVGHDMRFTLLDDYLHVVDTALWLSGGRAILQHGRIQTTDNGEMLCAEHQFLADDCMVTTCMHRRAGTQRESVTVIGDSASFRVDDMRDWQMERAQGLRIDPIPGWQSTLEQRGFVGAAQHFIHCVENQTTPQVSGDEALLAQRIVECIWREASTE